MGVVELSLKEPPATYLAKIDIVDDAASLRNAHRILHSWLAELQSDSPKIEIGNGWTPKTIIAAHDSIITRLKELDPTSEHNTPMTAAKPRPGAPIMLVPNYVSVVGSRLQGDGDMDVVIRDEKPSESLLIRLGQMLGEKLHVVTNPQGPHDEDQSRPLYHLVLMSVEQWRERTSPSAPITAAMETYKASLGGVRRISDERLKHRIILGAGLIRQRLQYGSDPEPLGKEIAEWVLGDDPFPLSTPSRSTMLSAAALWKPEDIYEAAEGTYVDAMVPVYDQSLFARGVRKISAMVRAWWEKNPFKNEDEALDAARELGVAVARELRER